jgi:uncharacterized delta-60 repeat protein
MTRDSRRVRGLVVALSTTAIVLGAPGAAVAGLPGRLDRSFGDGGRAQVAFGGEGAEARALAMQGHRAIVVGAVGFEVDEDMAVIRLRADGTLDRTFGGGDGRFTRNLFGDADIANAVAVLPDDKILVAGQGYDPLSSTGRFVVLRLTPDGRLDRTFGGGDGIVVTKFQPDGAFGHAMTLLPDGRFVVCGFYAGSPAGFALARYRANGGLDASFGFAGRVVTTFPGQTEAICTAITRVGAKVVAVGTVWDGSTYAFAAARYRNDGMLDPGFDGDGLATFTPEPVSNRATGVVPLPDGGVVLAGTVSNGVDPPDVALLRLDPSGTPATSFGGGDGLVIDDVGSADQAGGLIRQRDGRLIVVGFRNPDMFVARYKPLGARDASFGHDGLQASPWPAGASVASAAAFDGARVVVVGAVGLVSVSRFAAERLFR